MLGCYILIYRLVRHVDDYRDSSFIVVVYYDPSVTDFDSQSGTVTVGSGQGWYPIIRIIYRCCGYHGMLRRWRLSIDASVSSTGRPGGGDV